MGYEIVPRGGPVGRDRMVGVTIGFLLGASPLVLAGYPTEEASSPGTQATLDVDWRAALTEARNGSFTLRLPRGEETYLLSEFDFTANTRYYQVEANGQTTEVHPPKAHSFRGTVQGVNDSYVRLTIGPGYFGGHVSSGSSGVRTYFTLGSDDSRVHVGAREDASGFFRTQGEVVGSGGGAGTSGCGSSTYSPQQIDVVLEATSAYWNFNGGPTTWAEMQNGFNIWSLAFECINVIMEAPIMYAWISGGPNGHVCTGSGGLLTDLKEVWQTDRAAVPRDAVLLHHYHNGALQWSSSSGGGAGGCALVVGALSDPHENSYNVANMDDPNNRWKKMGHETGHLLDAVEITNANTGYLPGTDPCGGHPHYSGLMVTVQGVTDDCKKYAFAPQSVNLIRDCVEDWSSCVP